MADSAPPPSYKRKRSSKACIVCRQKKVRCSGTEPCRHCIEFGETVGQYLAPLLRLSKTRAQCLFDDSNVQSTKTLSELQLRVVRLEAYIVHITGSDLSPLVNFRQSGAEGDDENPLSTPGTGLPTELPTSATLAGSRKRQRQDETADPEAGPSVPNHASQASLQNGDESISAPQGGRRASGQQPAHPLQVTEDHRRESQSYMDEAHHLEDMTRDHTSAETIAAMNAERLQQTGQLVYHPFTSRIRATGRPIPPEEMFSTDEDDPSVLADNEATVTQRTDRTGGNTSQESASRDWHSIDDNAPRSPPPSSQPGYVNESSNTVGTPGGAASSSMKRTGSASSAPAALGPTTAKISSSNASELRPDKKGNLRYLGSASTSAVVAELADRQRWDVESPGLHSAAAAARRRSRAMPPQIAGTAGFNAHGQNGDAAASNSSSLTMVEEGDDNDMADSQRTTDPQQVSQKQHFARPPMRPKPWEIFSNLGVTVAGALPSVEEIALPPEDLARKLVDNFFEYLHPLFPVLHRAAVVKDMHNVYNLKSKCEMRKADPPVLTLLFAVFACGALVTEDPRVYEEGGYGEDAPTYPVEEGPMHPLAQWQSEILSAQIGGGQQQDQERTRTYNFGLSDQARRQGVRRAGHRYYAQVNILILHSLFQPSLDQAVLYGLMAFFHVSSNAAARAWLLSGQALRLAIELGLHRSSANFKPYVRERRRRVFWALFSLESLLANNLGRPSSIPLYEIDQERPENLNLDDLMPTVTIHGPPRKGEIAGFLHLIKLHWITAEALRTIARHQRQYKPITAAELQKRLLKYEEDLKQWYLGIPREYSSHHANLPEELLPERFIMNLSYPSTLLLLFMPFMPRKGEDATEFQTYALARCVYACKDHIDFSGQYQYPIPPSHYLFNITQHLLVAGALLLLICHRGLQDPKLLDLTLQDVDRALGVLKLIGERFVGGTVGTEMLQNMKDNMKHSETWKTREAKIAAMEAANAAGTNQTQGPPFPPMPLPGPRRIPGILQPSNGIETAGAIQTSPPQRIPTGLQEDQSMSPSRNSGHGNNTRQHEQSQASIQSPIVYTGNTAALPASSVGGSGQMQTQTNMTMPAYNVYEPGYLYPKQPVQYADQAQMSQTPMLGYTGGASNSNFLDDYYQMTAPAYATGTPYGSSSAMPTYNTPDYQPLWPSDSLNFNIKDLEEITARSYNNSLMNNIGQPNNGQQYPFFQF